jgi:hypothetical protein
MSSMGRGSRFALAPPNRTYVYGWLAFTLLFIAWVPLTWFHGDVVDRSPSGAAWYFGMLAVFLPFWFGGFVVDWRNRWNPAKNYVEIEAEQIRVQYRGSVRRRIDRSNIESADLWNPRFWVLQFLGHSKPTVALRLRRGNFNPLLFGGPPRTIWLPVVEPERFLAALGET